MKVATISAQTLKAWLRDGAELALVDVREQGIFYHQHLLFASCIPLSRLELMISDLVPRRGTRLVLCDGGGDSSGLARHAAAILQAHDYSAVHVLENGIAGWSEAGYELFSGINVPSKAFGEIVELRCGTPHISAEQLHARQVKGEKLVILDSRPMGEYHRMSIPNGIDCPGAELVYRVQTMAPDPAVPVIVNCAGRTRSIIGAQSLRNAGLPNPVMALKDGTMGWTLAGLEVATGCTEHAPEPSSEERAVALNRANEVAKRCNVQRIDRRTLATWQEESDRRSLYLLDVRTPAEYQAGHWPGSRNAPGGQLVQATDEYIATRNSRVVLLDHAEVRALMTASWLKQMGWREVVVLAGESFQDVSLQAGGHVAEVLGLQHQLTISAQDLNRMSSRKEIRVLDFSSSLQYRRGHIPGAWWVLRSRLRELLPQLSEHAILVCTADQESLAHLAATDLAEIGYRGPIKVLEGGNPAWRKAGFEWQQGADTEHLSTSPDDVWYKPYEHRGAVEQAMRDYLSWEVNLVEQIERDGDAEFNPLV